MSGLCWPTFWEHRRCFKTFGLNCENDCLATDGCIENCDDMVEVAPFGVHELGGLTDVVRPVMVKCFLLSLLWSVGNTVPVVIGHQ